MDFEERKPNSSQASSGKDDEMVNSEFVRLRQILPEEIWLLVATELEKRSSDGVENLANVSEFFHNLLATQRTTYLFEKVFTIVATSVWNKEGLDGLPVSDVLKCRGVSKHWNAVIDNLMSQRFQFFEEGSDDNHPARVGPAFTSILENYFYNWSTPEDDVEGGTQPKKRWPQEFLRHFKKTHPSYRSNGKCPWLWGRVDVNIYPEDDADVPDYQGFVKGLTSVLSKYGGHLHTFTLNIQRYHFFENPTLLQKWLVEMPNLKEFTFKKYTSEDDEEYDDDADVDPEDFDLNEAVEDYPFPKLKHLETLKIANLPVPMIKQLIRQNSHVTTLSINDVFQIDYDIFTFPIPNLHTLEMIGVPYEIAEKWSSSQVQWPLKFLKLAFNERFKCAVVLQGIQDKFADTLVELHLEVRENYNQDAEIWLDCENYRLDLPKLKKICVDFFKNPVCLDFLLPMRRSLEAISASFGYELPLTREIVGTSGTIVQFVGFEEKMLESNIWVIFRKLKTVEVIDISDSDNRESQYFSREEWMLNNVYD